MFLSFLTCTTYTDYSPAGGSTDSRPELGLPLDNSWGLIQYTMEGETYDGAEAGILTAIADTVRFYRCLLYFLSGGTYKECPYFTSRLQVGTSKPESVYATPFHSYHSSTEQGSTVFVILSLLQTPSPYLKLQFGSVITCVRGMCILVQNRCQSHSHLQREGVQSASGNKPRNRPFLGSLAMAMILSNNLIYCCCFWSQSGGRKNGDGRRPI